MTNGVDSKVKESSTFAAVWIYSIWPFYIKKIITRLSSNSEMNHQFKVKWQLPQGSRLHDGDYSTYKSNTLYYPVKTGREKTLLFKKWWDIPIQGLRIFVCLLSTISTSYIIQLSDYASRTRGQFKGLCFGLCYFSIKDQIEDSPLKQVMALRKIINYKYEILNWYCLSKLVKFWPHL